MAKGGFHRIDDVTWLGIRERLPRPWLPEEVAQDMRFWEGQRRARAATRGKYGKSQPGRPTLVKTWGWTEWRARAAMADVASWWDPQWGPPPADLQPTSSPHPETDAKTQEAPSSASSPHPADLQPTSSRAYSTEAQRQKVDPDPNLRDSPTLVDREPVDPQEAPQAPAPDPTPAKGSPKLAAWSEDLWTEIQAVRVELAPGCRPQKLTKERRQNLVARGRQIAAAGLGRADLIRAVRWVLTPSDNPHVRGAQATGDPVGVLLRPKHVVAYCELAEAEARTGPQSTAGPVDPALTAWDRLVADMPALGAACIRGAPPRVLAAVDALGGINRLCRLDGFDLSRQRPAFLSAFHRPALEPRHEPSPAESASRAAALHRPG